MVCAEMSYLLSEALSALSGAGEYATIGQGFTVWNRLWSTLNGQLHSN